MRSAWYRSGMHFQYPTRSMFTTDGTRRSASVTYPPAHCAYPSWFSSSERKVNSAPRPRVLALRKCTAYSSIHLFVSAQLSNRYAATLHACGRNAAPRASTHVAYAAS